MIADVVNPLKLNNARPKADANNNKAKATNDVHLRYFDVLIMSYSVKILELV